VTISSAIILGIVQGVAEFLPISSSGHLAVLQNLFDLSAGEDHLFFDVLLHLGTLISICVCYWGDIVAMVREVFIVLRGGRRADGTPVQGHLGAARLFLMIVVGTLPLFLVLPINDKVEELYYITPFIGAALLLTGCMLFVSDKMAPGTRTERNMRFRDALTIGLCQCVATIPGLSRSGTTITAGIATGLDRTFAMKYSFLLSLPAVLGANLLSFIKAIGEESIEASLIPAYLLGMLAAMLSGIAAISLMKLIAKKSKFGWFAYYCWGAGVLTIILSLIF
jgi:undecaprenyl-diphosphatase